MILTYESSHRRMSTAAIVHDERRKWKEASRGGAYGAASLFPNRLSDLNQVEGMGYDGVWLGSFFKKLAVDSKTVVHRRLTRERIRCMALMGAFSSCAA